MQVEGIANITVCVDSVRAVRDFYAEAIALPWGGQRENQIWLYWSPTRITLIEPTAEDRHLIGRTTGVTVRVRGEGDLGRLAGRIGEKGFHVTRMESFRGGSRLLVNDPSGNQLALWETPDPPDDLNYVQGPSQVAIRVADLRQSLLFYHAGLELSMDDQPDPGTAVFFSGATQLVITEHDKFAPCPPTRGDTGVTLRVDDVEAFVDSLRHRGARIVTEPQNIKGAAIATVADPSGNLLNLLSVPDAPSEGE